MDSTAVGQPGADAPMQRRDDPEVAIVMPAYDAAAFLPTTVPAARAAAGADGLVLVVDAGSPDDDTAIVAERLGARVLRLPARAGPAEARNAGVAALPSSVDIALFIDSDCVAHADVVARVRRAFAADAALVSLTGSYDDEPADGGFFSNYMNLRHHHTHQIARRDRASFWAGCGAVRLDAFRRVEGFDAARFPLPMVEDIELGLRLAAVGHTRLDPTLHVKHLKRWTLRSVVATDVFKRAVPWTELILERGELPVDLNLRLTQRLAAPIAPLALVSLVALPTLAAVGAPAIWLTLPAALLLVSWLLNADLLACFWRKRGPVFAVGCWLFHQVHLLYSATTFACVWMRHRVTGGGSAR